MFNLSFDKLQPLIKFTSRYGVIMVILIVGGIYAFLIQASGKLAEVEPSDTAVNEKYKGTSSPKIEDAIIDKLNELQDSNVQFQSLIDEARNNPFQE